MGIEGLQLKKVKSKQSYTGQQVKEIVQVLTELEKIVEIIAKRGVDFSEYVDNIDNKSHKMPLYMLKVD